MKNFKVIETNVKGVNNQRFSCDTRIRQDVELPFTETRYRCVMFNGIKIRLENKDEFIVGIIHG